MIARTPHQSKVGRHSQSLISRNRVRIVVIGILFCLLFVVSSEQSLAQTACPCSIWDESATPALEAENDPNPIEVGVRFRSDVDGSITGIRFYKGAANVGPHVGNLWNACALTPQRFGVLVPERRPSLATKETVADRRQQSPAGLRMPETHGTRT